MKANLNPYVGDDKVDIPIILEQNEYNDFNEEAPFSNTPDKLYIHTLQFNMKTWLYCLNHEGSDGSYPDNSGLGKTIKEIELGIKDWEDKRAVTDDSLYTVHYPEHLG